MPDRNSPPSGIWTKWASNLKHALIPLMGLVLVMSACSLLRSDTAPDDLSVEDHRSRSQEHAAEARAHRERYDADEQVTPDPERRSEQGRWARDYDYRGSGNYYWGAGNYNPSQRHLRIAREHEALAQTHNEAAHFLEQFEEAQCGSFPPETRVLCPLLGQLVSVEDIPGGSRVRFVEGVDLNAAIAHMRCHLAFARTQAESGMDSCPLYLKGVRVSGVESGSEVDILIEEPRDVEELRDRVKGHLILESP